LVGKRKRKSLPKGGMASRWQDAKKGCGMGVFKSGNRGEVKKKKKWEHSGLFHGKGGWLGKIIQRREGGKNGKESSEPV